MEPVQDGGGWGKKPLAKAKNATNNPGFSLNKPEPEKVLFIDPSIQLSLRAREGVFLVQEDQKDYIKDPKMLICENGNIESFSNDGTLLAVADNLGITIFNLETNKKVTTPKPSVVAMHFSAKRKISSVY